MASLNTIPGRLAKPVLATVTIANGAALSDAVDLKGLALLGVIMPASWTAAGITFQVSYDGGLSYKDLQSKTAEYALTAAAGQTISIPSTDLAVVSLLKVRSGTSASPVNQGAERVVTLLACDIG